MPKRYSSFLLAVLCCSLMDTAAQVQTPHYNTPIGNYINGFYDYLPQGYDPNGTTLYPVIIFLHGAGNIGNGSPAALPSVLSVGIPRRIQEGNFPQSFTVNNRTFRCIVISPQFTAWPSRQDANDNLATLITYVKQNYKADPGRIYMAGMSMGGGLTVDFAGSNAANARSLAAIVPVAEASGPVLNQARVMAAANLPVWLTHNSGDPIVPASNSVQYRDWINQPPAATPPAKLTIFTSNDHDAWTQTFDPSFTEGGLNVYQWMLQYERTDNSPLPVSLARYTVEKSGPNAALVSWTTTSEQNNHHFTIERSADGIHFNPIGTVAAVNMPSRYSFTDNSPSAGLNYYRLTQSDVDGQTTYYAIKHVRFDEAGVSLQVLPNPAQSSLQVKLETPAEGLFRGAIYTAGGGLVRQLKFTKSGYSWSERLDLSSLPSGTYTLQLTGTNYQQSVRFVKQ